MNNIYIIFLIAAPIATFFSGFLVARQFRVLQNVPLVFMIFTQRKWLVSAIMGMLISGIFSLIIFLETKLSAWNILAFFVTFLIASASHYFGIIFGWGRSLPSSESIALVEQTQINAPPDNVIVDDTPNSVKVTINTQKRWVWFVMSLFQLAFIGLCAFPIFGLMVVSILQDYLPKNLGFLSWIFVGGIVLYLIYTQFPKALEYVFDKEIIEIDNLSVKIEESGLGFKSRKEYSADNIKKITTMFSFGGTIVVTRRSPFVNSNMPVFMMWLNRGLKRYHSFGRAVDLADAQSILETIYSRFPQYKG